MKKLIFLASVVFLLTGCDAPNRSSERSEAGERAPVDRTEPDAASIHEDTTTSGGMNRQNQYDTLQ